MGLFGRQSHQPDPTKVTLIGFVARVKSLMFPEHMAPVEGPMAEFADEGLVTGVNMLMPFEISGIRKLFPANLTCHFACLRQFGCYMALSPPSWFTRIRRGVVGSS